jgi:hypothetical protein
MIAGRVARRMSPIGFDAKARQGGAVTAPAASD